MRTTHLIRHIIKGITLLIVIMLLCACAPAKENTEPTSAPETVFVEQTAEPVAEETEEPAYEPVFYSEEIPEEIRDKMRNVTISEKSPVTFDDLRYLTLTYLGYDDAPHTGHLVVADDVAEEVVSIFRELYEARFPIEKMNLPCEYGGVDELSMEDNNTSAFNDRPIESSGSLSYHQLGRAIDINTLVNPYIHFSSNTLLPVTAERYLDRTLGEKGMITEDSVCVKIFERYGWTWGGTWHSLKDYQHFEKH